MRRDKVKTNYTRIKESELAILAGKIAICMDNNLNFNADIKPSSVDLLAAAEDYRIKHEIAVNGGSSYERELKNEAKIKLQQMLTHLAHTVNVAAQGNTVALSSTGLIFNKQPSPLQKPGITKRIVLKDGRHEGQLRVDFDRIVEAYEYEVQIGKMDLESEHIIWEEVHLTSTSLNNIISLLIPGVRYYVRVRGRNKAGMGDWSDTCVRMVR